MKTIREYIDLIEHAQSNSPELRTWGNRSTGETHYSIDGVEVGKEEYYQAWRADQQARGNPDIKEQGAKVGDATGSQAHRLGSADASRGTPYDSNPYPAGSKERLEWSRAHNSIRARRAQDQAQAVDEDQATAQ